MEFPLNQGQPDPTMQRSDQAALVLIGLLYGIIADFR